MNIKHTYTDISTLRSEQKSQGQRTSQSREQVNRQVGLHHRAGRKRAKTAQNRACQWHHDLSARQWKRSKVEVTPGQDNDRGGLAHRGD